MITAHLSRGAEFHNRENDSKSISTNTTNYTEMTVIGSAKRIMQEVDKLPIHKFIEKEEEHNEHE